MEGEGLLAPPRRSNKWRRRVHAAEQWGKELRIKERSVWGEFIYPL